MNFVVGRMEVGQDAFTAVVGRGVVARAATKASNGEVPEHLPGGHCMQPRGRADVRQWFGVAPSNTVAKQNKNSRVQEEKV